MLLLGLSFCSEIQMNAKILDLNYMKVWLHPALYQEFRLAVMLLVV